MMEGRPLKHGFRAVGANGCWFGAVAVGLREVCVCWGKLEMKKSELIHENGTGC